MIGNAGGQAEVSEGKRTSDLARVARNALPFIAYAFDKGVDGAEDAGRAIEYCVNAVEAALAATGKQQVGEVVTDRMVEAALQSTVVEPNVGTPWRQVVALDDHADFIADMRKAIQAAISVQPATPDFSPATQAVADHCDRIFWRHNYYTLPLGPSDRAKPTRRRQSAVELVQKLGFQWKNEAWEPVGEVQGDGLSRDAGRYRWLCEFIDHSPQAIEHLPCSDGDLINDVIDAAMGDAAIAASQPAKGHAVEVRDREADRQRFRDPKFNAYLDQAITENGEFTTWHQLTNTTDAYYGYQAGLHDGAPDPFGAQGIDMGQFRTQVAELLRSEFDLEVADPEDHRHDDGASEAERIASKIAALIGQRDAAPGVGNG